MAPDLADGVDEATSNGIAVRTQPYPARLHSGTSRSLAFWAEGHLSNVRDGNGELMSTLLKHSLND